jgi:hypothetical protein
MTVTKDKRPDCFGKLENVFPKGEDGLRHTPNICLDTCPFKTACLQEALKGQAGLSIQEELVDRAYAAGMLNFMQRWVHKKNLNYQLKRKG